MSPILRLSLPFTLWLAGFSALYALHGLSCSRHWPAGLEQRPVLIVTAGLLIGLQALMLWLVRRSPDPSRFVQWTATFLAAFALGAAIWTWAPVLVLTGCR